MALTQKTFAFYHQHDNLMTLTDILDSEIVDEWSQLSEAPALQAFLSTHQSILKPVVKNMLTILIKNKSGLRDNLSTALSRLIELGNGDESGVTFRNLIMLRNVKKVCNNWTKMPWFASLVARHQYISENLDSDFQDWADACLNMNRDQLQLQGIVIISGLLS